MNQHVKPEDGNGITDVSYESVITKSYVDYALSVVVSRALPDVRDGLKPVHRRIMYAMWDKKLTSTASYMKCASVVGEVMGQYHPHGDSSIYDALVRMAQHWNMRQPLVDPQGNFGSIDGDRAAAFRYTESRMTALSERLLTTIDKNVVPFRDNYDGRVREPTVLPAEFPNLLVNGTDGIAVGMASSIPTHNLGEVCAAAVMVLDDPNVALHDLMTVLPGPDFPHGGVIKGTGGIVQAFATGRGGFLVHGVTSFQKGPKGRDQIVVHEIPFGVNKAALIEKIADLVKDGKILGIANIRDESDQKEFIRIAIDLKGDADQNVVLQNLYRQTQLATRIHYNTVCILPTGKPETLGVVDVLREFVEFRRQTVRSALRFDLDAARGRQDKLIGLYAATTQIDQVVALIRASEDADQAREALLGLEFPLTDDDFVALLVDADPDFVRTETWKLSVHQVRHILGVPLRTLTAQDQRALIVEAMELGVEIRRILHDLTTPGVVDNIIRNGLQEIAAKYGTPRRTVIEQADAEDIVDEDLIPRRDVVVTYSSSGYVKRTDLDELRAQNRGGVGRSGMATADDDYVVTSFTTSSHSSVLAFTTAGRVYSIRTWKLPEAPVAAKGRPLIRVLELQENEEILTLVPLSDGVGSSLVFVSDDGVEGKVRRNAITEFTNIMRNGKLAMDLVDGLRLVAVLPADDTDDVVIASAKGQMIRFPVTDVRVFSGRGSAGVRAMTLAEGDRLVSVCTIPSSSRTPLERRVFMANGSITGPREEFADGDGVVEVPDGIDVHEEGGSLRLQASEAFMDAMRSEEHHFLTISENGYGKRSSSHDYRCVGRGSKGVIGAGVSDKTGPIAACIVAGEDDEIVVSTNGAQTIRTRVREISVMGRPSQGVIVFRPAEGSRIVSLARIQNSTEE